MKGSYVSSSKRFFFISSAFLPSGVSLPASMPASKYGQPWFIRGVRCRLTVEKNVEETLLSLNLLDELLDLTLLGDVANEGNDLASNILSVGLLNGLELLLGTADNVDLGSIDSESLSGL
jgi:hypothetical protein